ncbi:hypothetical protein Y032_0001g33 [Ancylostoma ceylanicum]|uniref:Uncharacterized protein n=1 Tax=Ancylostoma ceylanicum TaxID=53326 RepID=A0A016W5G1_9BILA|nr:hypothetical protein Y032_0001g33 [Ancylostoma ceylanicum]
MGKQWGHRGLLKGPQWANCWFSEGNLGGFRGKTEGFPWGYLGISVGTLGNFREETWGSPWGNWGISRISMHALCAQMPTLEPAQAPSGHARIFTSAMRSQATASHTSCLNIRWAAVSAGPQLVRQVP